MILFLVFHLSTKIREITDMEKILGNFCLLDIYKEIIIKVLQNIEKKQNIDNTYGNVHSRAVYGQQY